MKKMMIVMALLTLSNAAFASKTIICREQGAAAGQGYEVELLGNFDQLLISFNGKKQAVLPATDGSLNFDSSVGSVLTFTQSRLNGLQVAVTLRGKSELASAVVKRGGFAGYQPIAELKACQSK